MSRLAAAVSVDSDVNIFFFFSSQKTQSTAAAETAAAAPQDDEVVLFAHTKEGTMERFQIILGTTKKGLSHYLNVCHRLLTFLNCLIAREFAGIPSVVDVSLRLDFSRLRLLKVSISLL